MVRSMTARLALAGALAVAGTGVAEAQEIRCTSRDYKYNFCRVGFTVRHVELVRRLSRSDCDFGRSWGYQSRGVWVNHGCEAIFALNPRGGGGGWGGSGGSWGGGSGWGGSGGSWQDWSVPGWAVGRWEGRERWQGRPVILTVYPGGPVRWQAYGWGGGGMSGHWRGADSIVLNDGTRIDVDRMSFDSRQIRLEWRGGRRMYFRRIG